MDKFGRRAEDTGLESTREILIEVRTDLRNLVNNYEEHKRDNFNKFEKIDGRLSSLETDRAKIWGGAGVIAVITAWLFKLIK